jgi:hypothetical protein
LNFLLLRNILKLVEVCFLHNIFCSPKPTCASRSKSFSPVTSSTRSQPHQGRGAQFFPFHEHLLKKGSG